jgi:hypothetical protein
MNFPRTQNTFNQILENTTQNLQPISQQLNEQLYTKPIRRVMREILPISFHWKGSLLRLLAGLALSHETKSK